MQANVWQFEQASAALIRNEREFSKPEAGRIVVRNYAIGINPVDWKFIDDNPRDWEKGHIPGVDGAGVVVAA